jgi:HK97 family phage prohead protease
MQQLDRFYAEFRSEDAEAGDRFEGYAAVFGQYAKVRGRLETVSTRAFDRALTEKHDVRLLVNHDPNLVLARTKNGSLQLRTDEHGLHVTAELPDTTYSRDVKELMRRGVLDQMSFGFVVRSDSYDQIKGVQVRSVDDVDLFDVSIVTMPAYPGTEASLRSWEGCNTESNPSNAGRTQLLVARHRLLSKGEF